MADTNTTDCHSTALIDDIEPTTDKLTGRAGLRYCQVNRFGTYSAPWPLSKLLILRSTDNRFRLQNPRILFNLTVPLIVLGGVGA